MSSYNRIQVNWDNEMCAAPCKLLVLVLVHKMHANKHGGI